MSLQRQLYQCTISNVFSTSMTDAMVKSIVYETTRPKIPLNSDRPVLETTVNNDLKIQLRAFQQSDLEHAHRLRTQDVVMFQTKKGVIDESPEETQTWMNRFLSPNDAQNLNFMLWAKMDDRQWEHIGSVGAHITTPVPCLGYMLRSEWWGKSIATKAVRLFLDMWWSLERKEVTLTETDAEDEHELHIMSLEAKQEPLSMREDGVPVVPEIIVAEIEENNVGSLRVIQKVGFQLRDREYVVEDRGTFLILDYGLSRPSP